MLPYSSWPSRGPARRCLCTPGTSGGLGRKGRGRREGGERHLVSGWLEAGWNQSKNSGDLFRLLDSSKATHQVSFLLLCYSRDARDRPSCPMCPPPLGFAIPVCSGMEMWTRQLPLTTACPPASRALRRGPSTGSFSRRSLTSWVGKTDLHWTWLAGPCVRLHSGLDCGEGGDTPRRLTWKNCSCFSGLQKKGWARIWSAKGRPEGSLLSIASISCRPTTFSAGGEGEYMLTGRFRR